MPIVPRGRALTMRIVRTIFFAAGLTSAWVAGTATGSAPPPAPTSQPMTMCRPDRPVSLAPIKAWEMLIPLGGITKNRRVQL